MRSRPSRPASPAFRTTSSTPGFKPTNHKCNAQCLEDFDIDFLKDIFSDVQNVMPKVQRHPEYLELVGKVINLYHDITEQAMQNQHNTQ